MLEDLQYTSVLTDYEDEEQVSSEKLKGDKFDLKKSYKKNIDFEKEPILKFKRNYLTVRFKNLIRLFTFA